MRFGKLQALAMGQDQKAPILGPTIDGRVDPLPQFGIDVKRDALRAFEELVGSGWLRSGQQHPVRTLWKRDDWLATLELLNLGMLIRRIRSTGSPAWWSAIRKKLRSELPGDRAGAAFELVAASLLHSHGQAASLPEAGHPGYDILLQPKDGGLLRISCKCLTISDDQRHFRTFVSSLQDVIAAQSGGTAPLEVCMFLGSRTTANTFNADLVRRGVHECILQYRSSKGSQFNVHGWFVVIRPLASFGSATFDPDETSYAFFCAQEHTRDEQKRFHGKLAKAIDGLRKHCGAVTSDASNAVLLKLPEWIDDQEAEQYVRSQFAAHSPHVSAVILFRSHVLATSSADQVLRRIERDIERSDLSQRVQQQDLSRTGTNIGFMARILQNPNAAVPLSTVAPHSLKFDVPFGHPIEGRPQLHFSAGDREIPLGRAYTYWRAEHSYRTEVNPESRQVGLNTFVLPGVSIRWRFFLRGEPVSPLFNVPSCPDEELVLL